MPLTLALGAGAFALIATALFRRELRDSRERAQRANEQIARLRSQVDEYEDLLSGAREVTVLWSEHASGPKFLGQPGAILPPGRRVEAILDFGAWLQPLEADRLMAALEQLKVDGKSFEEMLKARDGRQIRAAGWVLGGGTALRFRPAATPQQAAAPAKASEGTSLSTARTVLASLAKPAFLRDTGGKLIYGNAAYHTLMRNAGKKGSETQPVDVVEAAALKPHLKALFESGRPQALQVTVGNAAFELTEFPVEDGSAGYLQAKKDTNAKEAGLSHISAIIDALSTPIAIFNPNRELVQFNRAYCALWGLDPSWLKLGMDERAILDKMRTSGVLPNDPDYHGWRAKHLTSYQLKGPRETDWHLPDGRTVQVIAAPAGPTGGVIYVFEDITAQLRLKSQHRAVLDVQRSTLNALTEAVAVFGTNGRLTLSNPRLSSLWRIPTNLLAMSPHIDQIAEAVDAELEDGGSIWAGLKEALLDMRPNRSDRQGRINRADGKLIDYAIVRLPDGQSMITFLDVTESANYQRVLKERNDALITADRLKDAFVQNVSYELRSPLTNIIGFADLLASETAGTLTDKQRSYTDYIRASSVTLGVLIDNILDLATVDAGVAELRPEPQDIPTLIEKARAGLAATFPEVDGESAINLVVDMPATLPQLVADGTRVVQILYNLLSSAARFSKPGSEIRLSVATRNERVYFTVDDEGAEMSENMRAAIQDRVDTSAISGRQRAAGLGLAIVRTFVNLHGGTINVEQRKPQGSRVVVSLPLDAAMVGAAE
jgi:signal transduction histidine kinase